MALIGTSVEQQIWNYFKSKGMTDAGVAGLMGNLYAESALNPTNLQNSYEKKLGYTDAKYTFAVNNGLYNNFVNDSAGYGLAQWTYWSRKQHLLAYAMSHSLSIYAMSHSLSIGDLEMQLDFLYKELSESYQSVLAILLTANDILQASNAVLLQFEKPADQSLAVQKKRAEFGRMFKLCSVMSVLTIQQTTLQSAMGGCSGLTTELPSMMLR